MYHLIQDLVHGNTLLQIDARHLDADEQLEVQRINRKKKRDESKIKETDKDSDTGRQCGDVGEGMPQINMAEIQKKYSLSPNMIQNMPTPIQP